MAASSGAAALRAFCVVARSAKSLNFSSSPHWLDWTIRFGVTPSAEVSMASKAPSMRPAEAKR